MSNRRITAAALAALALSLSQAALAAPTTFIIDDPRNTASFESRAPIETVPGITHDVTGTITFDPGILTGPASGKVIVGVASLETGIGMRDEHLRGEKYLDTAKFPTATFDIERVVSSDKPKVADGETANLVVAGKLTIHGVTREIEAPVTVVYKKSIPELAEYYPGEVAAVRTSFDVKLADYGIERPQFLILKLDETIHVSVQFTAASGRTKAEG